MTANGPIEMGTTAEFEDLNPKSDPDLRRQIKEIMIGRWGERNAITSGTLNKRCGIVDRSGSGNPKVREALRDLILFDDMPIASAAAGNNGYFLVETSAEHEDELRSLKHREDAIRRRRHALELAVQSVREQRGNDYPAEVAGPQGQLSDW